MAIKVFLANDRVLFADGLCALLEAQRDIKVVGRAMKGYEAVKRVQKLRPDIAILDSGLPELNGFEASSQIRVLSPTTDTVILSTSASPEYVYRALQAGAKAYLPKESSGAELVAAVRTANAGKRYLSKMITATIVDDYVNDNRPKFPLESLTHRERHVLQLIVEGKSSAQTAKVLALSTKTVETYRSRIRQKLGIHDLPHLVKFAIRQGLTTLE